MSPRFVSALLLVFAGCGGKTESIDPPSSGGGTATGGSSSGGAGNGGVGTGGVSTGGASTGGASTGGAGGGLSFEQKTKAFCDKTLKLPCPPPDCEEEVEQAAEVAAKEGCFKEFEDVIDCALGRPLSCSPGNNEIEVAPECDPVLTKFASCISGSNNCSVGGGPNGFCSIQCDDWGGKCAPQGGGLQCVCTHGPNPNGQATFALTCDSPSWRPQLEALCS